MPPRQPGAVAAPRQGNLVMRVRDMLEAAAQNGEFIHEQEDTKKKIMSIATNRCGKTLG
tara:strand:+ start:145 stop:321 length:177 start_codon:yes stop_codon:yes gene_type:complete